jgi:hypothetical protein
VADGGPFGLYVADPLGEVEAALQKLRKNPGDGEALAALEQAVKRLKAGPKAGIELKFNSLGDKTTTKPKE